MNNFNKRMCIVFVMLAVNSMGVAVANNPGFHWSLGSSMYNEKYEEYVAERGGKVMQQVGRMIGIDLRLDYGLRDNLSFGAGYTSGFGLAEYTGQPLESGKYGDIVIDILPRQMHQMIVDTTYSLDSRTGIKGGLGYRTLTDHTDIIMTSGFRRKNTLKFVLLGVHRDYSRGDWTISPSFTYKQLLRGNQWTSYVGGINNIQKSGWGLDMAVVFAKPIGYGHSIQIVPFLRTWQIAPSETVKAANGDIMIEPKNKTRELGVSMKITF